jgi:sugar phosphate isomerase/epimerase
LGRAEKGRRFFACDFAVRRARENMAGLSINEMTTYRWSFEEDVTRYQAAGIKAIGIWRQKLADCGEDKAIELLACSDLKVSNLLWAGGFTGSDGKSFQEGLADAKEALHLAAALKTSHLVVYSGARNGHTQNHARRIFVSALDELMPLAEELKIVLDIEPMHAGCAEEFTFLTSLDDAMAVIRKVASPYLKLAFDTYHMGHDPEVVAHIAQVASYIGIVHLADSKCAPDREQNRHHLGEGILPLSCIVKALRQAGYNGYYDVELIGEAIERCDYRELLEGSKRAFRQLACG